MNKYLEGLLRFAFFGVGVTIIVFSILAITDLNFNKSSTIESQFNIIKYVGSLILGIVLLYFSWKFSKLESIFRAVFY